MIIQMLSICIYFYENIKTQVVVCSCLGDIYMYMTIIYKHLLCNRMADQSQTSWKGNEKVQVGKEQENAQPERDSHSKNRGGKKNKLTIRHLYHETYRKPNEQLFPNRWPNRWPLSYLNLIKNMKTYIRHQQHKKNLNTKT